MSEKTTLKPIAAALGTTFAVTLAASPLAQAADNPFELTKLGGGYMVAEEGKCGEAKCGGDAEGEGGEEGACGGDAEGEGDEEGGEEGACGGDKEEGEGACGG